ncbi:MAG TPA: nuclear transport factor 2 family protein [Kofleriaceae bacterium]
MLGARVRDALIALTPDQTDRAVAQLLPLYDPAMVFRDPIQELHGRDAFAEMNRRLLGRMRGLTWDVTSVKGDDSEAFLEWTMTGVLRLGPRLQVSGVTRVRAQAGLVVDHRDYWDLGEMFASAVPGGERLLHLLRKPFA